MQRRFLILATCAVLAFVFTSKATGSAYVKGDVFVAVGGGVVDEFSPTGGLVQILNDTTGSQFTTGMAFNGAGDLFVTNFSTGSVSEFDNSGNLLNATFVSGISLPEAIVFNKAGDMFVTSVGGTGITEYNSSGTLLNTFIAGTRTDWMDLSADQKTMLFTDESGAIHTLDLSTNTQGADLFNNSTGGAALRILGDGSVLLAGEGTGTVQHVVGGALSNSYTVGGSFPVGFPFALNLDPNGTSFWTADPGGNVDQVDIGTGTILNGWSSGSGSTFGLAVFGEITQGGPPGVPEPTTLLLLATGLCGVVAKKFKKS